jgi:tripartite-type tricarboxylate transporter receptor subunit TctC
LIAQAKANPDRLNYASQGSGSTSHLAESFKMLSATKITHIPYKGSAPALADLLGGQVQMMFAEISTALPHVRSGRVRALAVGSEKRNPLLPDVPAMSEFLPEFYSATWTGVVAPPKTPQTITTKLSAAITEALKPSDAVKRAQEMSAEMVAGTPAEMTQFMKQERALGRSDSRHWHDGGLGMRWPDFCIHLRLIT